MNKNVNNSGKTQLDLDAISVRNHERINLMTRPMGRNQYTEAEIYDSPDYDKSQGENAQVTINPLINNGRLGVENGGCDTDVNGVDTIEFSGRNNAMTLSEGLYGISKNKPYDYENIVTDITVNKW